MATPKVLVVEDEQEIRELICLHLLRQGYLVQESGTAEEAAQKIQAETFDCLVLDWMLPGLSGLDLISIARAKNPEVPILMVTAKAEPEDVIRGLEAGADDYIPKPFENAVLLARVKALLRRGSLRLLKQQNSGSDTLIIGALQVNRATYEAKCGEESLHLTPSEFKLLTIMIENQGRVMTRDQLVAEVNGEGITVVGRTIDTHVFGLRKKMGECADLIETIRGVGYRVRLLG